MISILTGCSIFLALGQTKLSLVNVYNVTIRCLMSIMLDCSLKACGFDLQLHYRTQFWTNTLGKNMNPLIPPAVALITSLLFFYKDCFGIEWPTHFDILFNKEIKPLLSAHMVLWLTSIVSEFDSHLGLHTSSSVTNLGSVRGQYNTTFSPSSTFLWETGVGFWSKTDRPDHWRKSGQLKWFQRF